MNIPIKLSLQTRKPINFPFCGSKFVLFFRCCCWLFFFRPLHTSIRVRCKWWPDRGVLLINIRCRVQRYAFVAVFLCSSCCCRVFGFGFWNSAWFVLGFVFLLFLLVFVFFCAKLTLFREGVELFKKRLVHHQERTCRIQFLLL